MKKIFFLSAIVFVALSACNQAQQTQQDRLTPGPEAVSAKFKAADSIPRTIALQMIRHYRNHFSANDATLMRKDLLDSVQISLTISDLNEIFKLDSITRLRVFAAAYLPDDSNESRKNKVTVLLQLRHGYHSQFSYYDAESIICPPPPGCGIEYP